MKVHLAISVKDIKSSVEEYSKLLKVEPLLVIKDEYALFKTDVLNMSIRVTDQKAGEVRHVGFEDEAADVFSEYIDSNGLLWERFSAKQQADEINSVWEGVKLGLD